MSIGYPYRDRESREFGHFAYTRYALLVLVSLVSLGAPVGSTPTPDWSDACPGRQLHTTRMATPEDAQHAECDETSRRLCVTIDVEDQVVLNACKSLVGMTKSVTKYDWVHNLVDMVEKVQTNFEGILDAANPPYRPLTTDAFLLFCKCVHTVPQTKPTAHCHPRPTWIPLPDDVTRHAKKRCNATKRDANGDTEADRGAELHADPLFVNCCYALASSVVWEDAEDFLTDAVSDLEDKADAARDRGTEKADEKAEEYDELRDKVEEYIHEFSGTCEQGAKAMLAAIKTGDLDEMAYVASSGEFTLDIAADE